MIRISMMKNKGDMEMAKVVLNGVQVKKLRKGWGHEGEDIFCGDVYVDGHFVGTWAQDGYGGPDRYDDAAYKAISERAKMFASGYHFDDPYGIIGGADVFMGMYMRLVDYIKFLGKHDRMHVIEDRLRMSGIGYTSAMDPAALKKAIDDMRVRFTAQTKCKVREFEISKDDAVITVDKDHPAPEFFHEVWD